jgi:hypothetical protein
VLVLSAFVSSSLDARASGVRIVDASGQKNFSDIQPAIDAAVDGDILLVGAGTYGAFTVQGKSLVIVAAPSGANVHSGKITITGVTGKCVVIGLTVTGPQSLVVTNCSGVVGIQDCSFDATLSYLFSPMPTAEFDHASSVILSGSSFRGATGVGSGQTDGWPGSPSAVSNSSSIAAYACTFVGGQGGDSDNTSGAGGDGFAGSQDWLFAAGCLVAGGPSGSGNVQQYALCGLGGNGLVAYGEVHLFNSTCKAGGYGHFCDSQCDVCLGFPITGGGTIDFLAGTSRTFATPSLSVDRNPWTVSIHGAPGDTAYLNRSTTPIFRFDPSLSGVCTSLVPPFALNAPIGVAPHSGSFTTSVRQRALPVGEIARLYSIQGFVVNAHAATILGTPRLAVSLNWDAPPDCNGNGINDYAEVIAGVTPDANHDLVPDNCP